MLKDAIYLAKRGFRVFPLKPNSKLPLINNFPEVATTDKDTITKWWTDPVMGIEQPYNIGISTEDLVVVDVDNKDADNTGEKSVMALELEGRDFPMTFSQETPTGGLHFFYKTAESVKQGVNVLGPKIDIRAKGGYVVGAGSLIDGKRYTLLNEQRIMGVPKWILEECGRAPEKPEKEKEIIEVNPDAAKERAIFYLENEAPEAIEGDGGDATTYAVAARVKDYGIPREECADLLMEHWFEGCGWTPENIQTKVDNAYEYGTEAQGSLAPEAHFDSIEDGKKEKSYLEQLNDQYALVYLEGSHFIIHETIDEKGRKHRSFLNENTFRRKLSPYRVQQESGAPKTYAQIWLDWSGRREFKGVVFAPEREARHDYYNLWRGFTVEPIDEEDATADQKLGLNYFKTHVLENVCGRDVEHYNWVIGFFAHMIQKPYERPRTTLVFRGEKGVGKNAMVDRVGSLLGSGHYLVAHDSRYLTSNFNGHMDSCLLLVLDEAFWSGDKGAEGKLKGLTTSPEIMIERKGKEPYMIDNLARFIIIGNESWLVPASHDERRYAVFDVGNGKKQDLEFFSEMRRLLDDEGGGRLLLSYLQNFDLNCTNLDVIPKTSALLDQKEASLDITLKWWRACLEDGVLRGAEFADHWEEWVGSDRFRNAFKVFARDEIGTKSWLPDEREFGKIIKPCIPTMPKRRKLVGGKRVYHYRLPVLADCRRHWDKYMGQETNWEEEIDDGE